MYEVWGVCVRILLFYLGLSFWYVFFVCVLFGICFSFVIVYRKFKFNCKFFDFVFIDVLMFVGSYCLVVFFFDNIYLVYVKRIMCIV